MLRAASVKRRCRWRLRDRPELALLDLGLPGMDGLELAERLKKAPETAGIRVIMVTGNAVEDDIVRALEGWADDYVTKPVRPRVLLSRIRACCGGRGGPPKPRWIRLAGLVIDSDAMAASVDGRALELTRTEFELLRLLAGRPNRVYSRDQIIGRIRGAEYFVTERSIDYQICGLRKKLGSWGDRIETVRGAGYKMRSE